MIRKLKIFTETTITKIKYSEIIASQKKKLCDYDQVAEKMRHSLRTALGLKM